MAESLARVQAEMKSRFAILRVARWQTRSFRAQRSSPRATGWHCCRIFSRGELRWGSAAASNLDLRFELDRFALPTPPELAFRYATGMEAARRLLGSADQARTDVAEREPNRVGTAWRHRARVVRGKAVGLWEKANLRSSRLAQLQLLNASGIDRLVFVHARATFVAALCGGSRKKPWLLGRVVRTERFSPSAGGSGRREDRACQRA